MSGAQYTVRFVCQCPGCFAGMDQIETGSHKIGLGEGLWAKHERAGWTLQDGRYYCPVHESYRRKVEAASKVNPEHIKEAQRMIYEGDVLV